MVLVVNKAPFPQSDKNELGKEVVDKTGESKEVSNEGALSQMFDLVDNGAKDEEEQHIEEVHMFHQRATPYNLRNRQVCGPFMTSIPPNNFSTPPDPNASNNPPYPKVPT